MSSKMAMMMVLGCAAASGCALDGADEVGDELGRATRAVGDGDAPYDVYLILGQSNAVGGAGVDMLGAEDAAIYDTTFDEVPFAQEINCPKDGSLGPCQTTRGWHGLAPRGGRLGIELSAGRRLHERTGGRVALIKHATNGSNLVHQWDSSGHETTLWSYASEFIDARMAELPAGSRIAGLFWVQGNGDANTPTASSDYAENLSWLIMRLRQERGCVPVVLDRLHPATGYPYGDTVREEQEQVATFLDDVVVVDSADLVLRDIPPQHYDATSFITLGRRMADAMPLCAE